MSDISGSIYKIHFLDELSNKKTWIHSIHPLSKLLVTVSYLLSVVSFDKYVISMLLPFIFYPIIIFSIGEIPLVPILKRILVVAPVIIGVGMFSPFLDTDTGTIFLGVPVSAGWISFLSLILKSALTVIAALLLLSTTGMERIAVALRMLRVPRIFVLQLLLIYRYISVLTEGAARVWNAYMLRAPGQKGVNFRAWGPLAGQMLIRTFDRAHRVYQAMELRGFTGEYNPGGIKGLSLRDFIYLFCWTAFFIAARVFNLPSIIGTLITGVIT